MPTPRFRDLSPQGAAAVVAAFLGQESEARFTEKLAGQHLTAVAKPGGKFLYGIKTESGMSSGGYFPDLEDVLRTKHPPVKKQVTYQFEVLRKENRPDYIDYPLASTTAVEYSGAMSKATAAKLNAGQKRVRFMTKDSIEKSVADIVGEDDRFILERFLAAIRSGKKVPKSMFLDVEEVLMDLLDRGKTPSSIGGPRIEGLFGDVEGGFKIPSRAYADLQVKQAKFYAVVRSGGEYAVPGRFAAATKDPSADGLVSDVLKYVDEMATKGPGPGFKVFFDRPTARALKSLADKYRAGDASAGRRLAQDFFRRVGDKRTWVSSNLYESVQVHPGKSFDNRMAVPSDQFVELVLEKLLRISKKSS